jgi:adenosylhomocysteine nucleosidase
VLNGGQSRPVLFIAAERREYVGLLRHCRDVERLRWPIDLSCSARLGGQPVVLAANGVGPELAAAATTVAMAHVRPIAVVSTGFCGALDPLLRVADIFVATAIQDLDVPVQQPHCQRAAAHGTLVSIDRIAQTAGEKQALRDRGAAVVEMEAAGVAQVVRQCGIPFCCIRVVSDTAEEGFCIDLNSARLPDGRLSTGRILASAMRRPVTGIRELYRLFRNTKAASQSLGDFLADCRF